MKRAKKLTRAQKVEMSKKTEEEAGVKIEEKEEKKKRVLRYSCAEEVLAYMIYRKMNTFGREKGNWVSLEEISNFSNMCMREAFFRMDRVIFRTSPENLEKMVAIYPKYYEFCEKDGVRGIKAKDKISANDLLYNLVYIYMPMDIENLCNDMMQDFQFTAVS
jgi:hypothetical protein